MDENHTFHKHSSALVLDYVAKFLERLAVNIFIDRFIKQEKSIAKMSRLSQNTVHMTFQGVKIFFGLILAGDNLGQVSSPVTI